MEILKKYAINEAWKLCTIAGFLGLFFLTLQIFDSITTLIGIPLQTAANSTGVVVTEPVLLHSSGFEDMLFSSTSEADPPISGAGEYNVPTGSPSDMGVSSKATWQCRMYEGRWVYKPEENPRYHVEQCFFVEDKMSCRKNGRPDFEYEGWGWESDGCQIPLFNGTDMLERLRGKRMIIVGDSLNRNQWESLACLLYTTVPPDPSSVDAASPAYKVLKVKDYEFTLEFYWAPFLVHLDESHKSGLKVLSLDKLVPSSKQWRGADVMVWDVFEYEGEQLVEMKTELAYERALTVWAEWLAKNTGPMKTKVYFRSISPEHQNKQWCFNHIHPMEPNKPYKQRFPRSMINVVERKIKEINGQYGFAVTGGVQYLNITGLSSKRIDAHPSIFRFRSWKVIVEKYKRLIKPRSDCSHWCLPGVPDTWNQILYASLFFDHLSPGDSSPS
ncbi:hypothetical protein V2J09_009706 [Rumex salicifolius]